MSRQTTGKTQGKLTTTIVKRQEATTLQNQALARMPAQLRRHRAAMLDVVNKAAKGFLDAYRDLGKYVQQALDDPESPESGTVELLAQSLGWSANTLYKAHVFYKNYTEAEYKLLQSRTRPNGESLTWSHVIALLSVSDKKQRSRLECMAATEGLTAEELSQLINDEINDGKTRRGSGRPFSKPKSLREFTKNFCRESESFRRKVSTVTIPMLQKVMELPPDQFDKQKLKMVTEAEAETQELITHMQKQLRALSGIKTRCCNVLGIDEDDVVDEDDEE